MRVFWSTGDDLRLHRDGVRALHRLAFRFFSVVAEAGGLGPSLFAAQSVSTTATTANRSMLIEVLLDSAR
jgi:hypothetical protein